MAMSHLNCVHSFWKIARATTASVIPKRYRYYWEQRPENRQRKLMMQVTLPRLGPQPFYEPKVVEDDVNTMYGLDLVLHREVKEIIHSCKMILVFLRAEMEITEYFRMKHELRKKDILLDEFPNHVMVHTLKDSPHRNLSALYHTGDTLTVYSPEPKVAETLKLTRRSPYLSLMGGLIENRLASTSQVLSYSKLPSLDITRGMLSQTLSQISSATFNLLQQNQTQTVQYLDQYIKDQTES